MYSRFVAKDDDFTTEFNTVSYWLDISVEHFYIDSSSGALYLSKELDYENKTQHQFTVRILIARFQINKMFESKIVMFLTHLYSHVFKVLK